MADMGLVEQLAAGQLDAEEFNRRLEQEAAEAAEAARERTRAENVRKFDARRKERRRRERAPAEISRNEALELELARERIKSTADKARSI